MTELSKSKQQKIITSLQLTLKVILITSSIWITQINVHKQKEKRQRAPLADTLQVNSATDTSQRSAETPVPSTAELKAEIAANPPAKRDHPADPAPQTGKARMLDDGLYILIIKDKHALELYNNGKKLKTYSVGLGKYPEDKAQVGDMRTPEGHFYINFIRDSSGWTHDFKDGKGETAGAYGPWFMALYTGKNNTFSGKTWTGIGIHGTHNPASIGTNDSEGCIRMYNNELQELKNIIGEREFVVVDIVAKQ